MALLREYRAFLSEYRHLFEIHRALLREYRAFLSVYGALFESM